MKDHRLKTWHPYFDAVKDGSKPFELRLDDRGFEVGDTLTLLRYDPKRQMFSGELIVEVAYTLHLKDFLDIKGWRWAIVRRIIPNLVVLGVRPLGGDSNAAT